MDLVERSFLEIFMRLIRVEPVEDVSRWLRFILMRIDDMIEAGMDERDILRNLSREVVVDEPFDPWR